MKCSSALETGTTAVCNVYKNTGKTRNNTYATFTCTAFVSGTFNLFLHFIMSRVNRTIGIHSTHFETVRKIVQKALRVNQA